MCLIETLSLVFDKIQEKWENIIDKVSVAWYPFNRRDKMRDVKEPEIRRAEIMDAAMQLFIEQGYTNTTTQDIVDKVNISRGLLY